MEIFLDNPRSGIMSTARSSVGRPVSWHDDVVWHILIDTVGRTTVALCCQHLLQFFVIRWISFNSTQSHVMQDSCCNYYSQSIVGFNSHSQLQCRKAALPDTILTLNCVAGAYEALVETLFWLRDRVQQWCEEI